MLRGTINGARRQEPKGKLSVISSQQLGRKKALIIPPQETELCQQHESGRGSES